MDRRDARPVVWLIDHGWHVDITLPGDSLTGKLALFRQIFPGAQAVVFGYGKRTFLTAPPDAISEYLLGPIPGPSAIQVTALSVLPPAAYRAGDVTELTLPEGAAQAISTFIWSDLQQDNSGNPRLIGPGPFPGSEFYAARSGYSLGHTCNAWVADALAAGGLGVSGAGVVTSGQLVGRATEAGACLASPPR